MNNNTQRQLELQERLETLSEAIIYAIECMAAQGIQLLNNEFEAAQAIISKLEVANALMGGDGV